MPNRPLHWHFLATTTPLLLAACNGQLAGVSAPTPGESPSPAVLKKIGEPCESPELFGDSLPDPWLRATVKGSIHDDAGNLLDNVALQAKIVALGNQAELAKAIPPTKKVWAQSGDHVICMSSHVLMIGDFTTFPSGSDTAATASKAGYWTIERAPAGATLALTFSKDGYETVTKTITVEQNPNGATERNTYAVTMRKRS